MSKTSPRLLAIGYIGTLSLLLGCSELPEAAWEGEYVTFAADHPEQLCGGTRDYLDKHAGKILDDLRSKPIHIDYYWLDDVADHCPQGETIIGCGSAGLVFSKWVPHLHEIVHARDGKRMPAVFEEGFAFHFGDASPVYNMASRERLSELVMNDLDGISGAEEYSRAAHFLAFISETYGRESLLLLDAALTRKSSAQEVDVALRAIFGRGRAELLAAYESYPECAGNVDVSVSCDREPAARLDALHPVFERRIECVGTDVIGPFEGMAYTQDVIEVGPAVGDSRFLIATGDGMAKGGNVLIRRCGPCSENGVTNDVGERLMVLSNAELPAGRYLVEFHVPVDAGPVDFGVFIGG